MTENNPLDSTTVETNALASLIASVSDNKRSWTIVGVLGIIVAIFVAYLIISLILAKRKVQVLSSKCQQYDEEIKQLQEEQKLVQEKLIQDEIGKRISEDQLKIDDNKAKIKALEDKRDSFISGIEGLTSWGDISISGPSA